MVRYYEIIVMNLKVSFRPKLIRSGCTSLVSLMKYYINGTKRYNNGPRCSFIFPGIQTKAAHETFAKLDVPSSCTQITSYAHNKHMYLL